jgi:hypothetical protein
MAPKGNDFDRDMQHLEAEIKRLQAEYNMFFAGRLPRLPWETRARVDALVKRFDRMQIRNTAERFRFGTLQAQYTSFCDLWERALRAKEEGRPGPGRRPAPPPTKPAKAEPAGPVIRVVHVAAFRDPMQEVDRLKDLYERLAEARTASGEQPVPYHRFVEVVRAQVSKLGGGDTEVAFRVAVKDGKVTLTAKAMKDGE